MQYCVTNKEDLIKIQDSITFIITNPDDFEIDTVEDFYNALVSYLTELWYNKKIPPELKPSRHVYIITDRRGKESIKFSKEFEDFITAEGTLIRTFEGGRRRKK